MKEQEIQRKIIEHVKKLEWPSTTEDIAKACKISWNTAQVHLLKLRHDGKVKYRKVGRQNQWWLETKYRKEMQ